MKYLLSILLMFNVVPKEPPRPAETHIHPNYIIEEIQHVDDDNEADNNESVEIINNILK